MLMEGYRFGAWRYTVKPKNIFRDNIFLEGGCVTVSLFYKTCIPMCTDKSFTVEIEGVQQVVRYQYVYRKYQSIVDYGFSGIQYCIYPCYSL